MKISSFTSFLIVFAQLVGVTSFAATTSTTLRRVVISNLSSLTTLQAKKGFASDTPKKRENKKNVPEPSSSEKTSETTASSSSSSSTVTTSSPVNAGQRALAEMRRQRAEQKDAELRKVREMMQADQQVKETPAAIPEVVAQRMGRRMLPFVGLPFFGGLTAFVTFWYLATYKNIEFQPALVAFSTIAILVFSLLGITYSLMSASWDEDREGDFWGFDEFKRNVDNIREGLQRSRENLVLRENMAGLNDGEVTKALKDLENRENAQSKPKTLGEKMKQDGFD